MEMWELCIPRALLCKVLKRSMVVNFIGVFDLHFQIALVVMTSLLRESRCLIGLIGVRRNSPVPHPPRGIAKPEQTPRP